jgi:hypothetical protein
LHASTYTRLMRVGHRDVLELSDFGASPIG